MDQEVDVKLFITCRLCLDEPGAYQIVPCIKGQINFCFGIDVDPFDGLPQLICKKCKGILTEVYAKKILFLEKQKKLHNKLPKYNNDAQTSVPLTTECVKSPSAADAIPHNSEELAVPAELACHGISEKSVGATDVCPPGNSVNPAGAVDVARNRNAKKRRSSWKKPFNRHFVCTICNKSFLTENSVKRHSPMHKKIISKHDKIFKNYLTVQLNKIDKKKNSTGCLQNVVYNKDKIISARRTSKYHSFYLKKVLTTNDKTKNVPVKRPMVLSDSSDEKNMKGKKRKSHRLFSSSSREAVVFERNKEPIKLGHKAQQSNPNEMVVDKTDYINLDDINLDDTSSDGPKTNSELEKKTLLPKPQQVKAEVADYKAIQNIATMCLKNYIKKANTDASKKSTYSESSLKHKVLSLGRKVIHKQGFSCTGLLRYMEHKDLDMTWTPTSSEMQKKGSNFVRIMTQLKSREGSENDDACWKNLHDISFCRDSGVEASLAPARETSKSEAEEALPPAPAPADGDAALAGATCESNDPNCGNKLLNKTPVANPKQLPKKNLPETKPGLIKANDAALVSPSLISNALEDADIEESKTWLPVIASISSLYVPDSEKENQSVPVLEKPTPRIKVKPASELMPAWALNNQETVEDVWKFNPIQSSLPHHLTNTAVSVEAPMTESQSGVPSQASATLGQVACQNDSRSQIGESNRKDVSHLNHDTFITLDSPQFPNTKTRAPFQYFRKILLMFRLKLLDLNEQLPPHFYCLIKFKLVLRQDTKTAIGVLLSLFCSKDTFCFNFRDTNSKMFDPNLLSAFWQWELLKIYKGDVVDRILQTAMNAGKDVHENTKLFLCLLKSINLITET